MPSYGCTLGLGNVSDVTTINARTSLVFVRQSEGLFILEIGSFYTVKVSRHCQFLELASSIYYHTVQPSNVAYWALIR